MKRDIVSKDVLKTLVKDIAKYILKVELGEFEFIDKELLKIEKREADIVIKSKQDIFHIEIQNSNDKSMPYRMLRYYSDLKFMFKECVIHQYLIYIGKSSLKMQECIEDKNLPFRYDIIDMKSISCERFLKMDSPGALVISILCDFESRNKEEVVLYIIKRLKELTNETEFRKYMLILEVLSENKDLKDIVKKGEEMITNIDYTKLPSFEIGWEKGMEKGMQEGMEKGMIEAMKKAILGMKEVGISKETIAKALKIDIEEVEKNLNRS